MTSSKIDSRSDSVSTDCPLCGHDQSRFGWAGALIYRGVEYVFRECLACGSLFCDPMPDDTAVRSMYGATYCSSFNGESQSDDPRQTKKLLQILDEMSPGTFMDFGCGDGCLLEEAADRGWDSVGVEVDAGVADRTARRTGLKVLHLDDEQSEIPDADVLHLGDVIEHLTDLRDQFAEDPSTPQAGRSPRGARTFGSEYQSFYMDFAHG